jgi:hypothetical protein
MYKHKALNPKFQIISNRSEDTMSQTKAADGILSPFRAWNIGACSDCLEFSVSSLGFGYASRPLLLALAIMGAWLP